MSLRFFFRFEPGVDPVEIPYARLAAEHPKLAALREHIRATTRQAEARAGRAGRGDLLADQAFAGFLARCMRSFGAEYLDHVMGALDRIYKARESISDQLDRALKGELPDFARMKESFNEIDAAFPEVIEPGQATPTAKIELGSGTGLTSRVRTLGEFLSESRERLSARSRQLLERADRLEPEALSKVLEETRWPKSVEKSRPLVEALIERLRAKGFDHGDVAQVLGALEEWSLPDQVRKASDDAIEALGADKDLPRVRDLQAYLRKSPILRALLSSSPEQLRTYWRDYKSKFRIIRFGLYTWYRMHHVRGAIGEWTAAFDLGRSGVIIFLKGPKAEVTTGGTDLLAIDRNTGQVYAIDNKATLRTRVLERVSALMRNFPQNLAADIAELRAALSDRSEPAIESVLRRMDSAERRIRNLVDQLGPDSPTRKRQLDANVEITLPSGERKRVQAEITDILQEHGISRLITNSGGVLERVTQALGDAGIELENLNAALPEGEE
jgi:hypothetical protein